MMTTYFGTVEADHTVKVSTDLPVGERVMIVQIPSMEALMHDSERQRRFAATRDALQKAVGNGYPPSSLSDEEIVALVKRARRATSASSSA